MSKYSLILLLSIMSINAHSCQKTGKAFVNLNNEGYTLNYNGQSHSIENGDIDPLLRKMNSNQLESFQTKNDIVVKQMSDGSFVVRPELKLNGSGPIAGWLAYWITKAAGVTGIVAASSVAPGVAPVLSGVLTVESVSASAGAFFSLLPFLP